MHVNSKSCIAVLIAGLCSLGGCATTASSPRTGFSETYTGSASTASLKLDLLKRLPLGPPEGWLNTVDRSLADGRFSARRRGAVEFKIKPSFVSFQAEKEGQFPPAKYYRRDGALTICVLTLTLGTEKGSDKMAFRGDYDLCVTMHKTSK
jgi:hypothetical protein